MAPKKGEEDESSIKQLFIKVFNKYLYQTKTRPQAIGSLPVMPEKGAA
jgi:hypothetical protein